MGTPRAERMRQMRERRAADHAAALAPVPDAVPRAPDELLLPAVEQSIEALQLGERDQAVAQLARVLAQPIDESANQSVALRVLGPQLQKALEAIGGTPASRARLPKKTAHRSTPNRIAQLRAAHANSPAVRKRHGALSRATAIPRSWQRP